MSDDKLPFKTYRTRRRPLRWLRGSGSPGVDEIDRELRSTRQQSPARRGAAAPRDASPGPQVSMRTYRAGGSQPPHGRQPRPPREPVPADSGAPRAAGSILRGAGRTARRIGLRRVLKWTLVWAVAWVVLSGVLFFVSATLQSGRIDDDANQVLGGGGNMITSPANVLVLGIDRRPRGSREPGANTMGARADSIMVLRTGGGKSARLSILRDSYAQIPGYPAQKINAAFALGGTALAVQAVEGFTGIDINHVIIVDFENFPALIDALGGVDVRVRARCIRSDFSGVHFALPRGEHHLSGAQALRYARVRKNACVPSEDDRARARRQQEVIAAMKDQVFSVWGFIRMPLIAWNAPKAIVTDMGPFNLAAFMASMAVGPQAKTVVLEPSGPGPGGSIVVSEQEKARALRRFER